ncbi:hypothetical protein H5410_004434 [Solanum commersonii]|uniref:Uncharacterized protein n=1 Tax=Solanum commersonii TaxID=4109 RepID=A0A9J6B7D0_SOLCO|nr:hypothetical protein H5410_004434 [Solanum commersonii]
MALQKLQKSFLDDYNRIEAYANELRLSNLDSDIVINSSNDGLEQGLRPYIVLDEIFLKGQCKGQLLTAWSTYEENSKYYLSAFGALSKNVVKNSLRYPPNLDTICKNQIRQDNLKNQDNEEVREKEENASKWTTNYSLKCMQFFIAYMKIAQLYNVDFNGDLEYEVSEGEDRHLSGEKMYIKEAYLMTYRAKLMHTKDQKNTVIKRAGEWTHSRKETKMTCSKRRTKNVEEKLEAEMRKKMKKKLKKKKFKSKSYPNIRPQVIYENVTKLKVRMNQLRSNINRVISLRGDRAEISEPTDLSYPLSSLEKNKKLSLATSGERERMGKLKTKKANGRSQI